MPRATDGAQSLTVLAAFLASASGAWAAGPSVGEAPAGVKFRPYQTHSHVELPSDPQVEYSVEKIEKDGKIVALKLIVKNLAEVPVEAPRLPGAADARTESVRVTKTRGTDGEDVVYEFVLTKDAVRSGVEYFDYRTKSPSSIQLDYWLHAAAGGAEGAPAAAKADAGIALAKPDKSPAKLSKRGKSAPKITASHPSHAKSTTTTATAEKSALTGVRSDADDSFPGCGTPLRKGQDVFARFKVWHRPYDYRGFFKLEMPDAGYAYPYTAAQAEKSEKAPARPKELAHYRLAHKLYREQQYALALRTIDFFGKNYPKSKLAREVEFLKANTLIQLSKFLKTDRFRDQAGETFRRFLIEDSGSAKSRSVLAYYLQLYMDGGLPVRALEYAMMGAEAKGYSKEELTPWIFRLAQAETLYGVGEHDRAERAYQAVVDADNALTPDAAFRIGEVYQARKLWERAAITYERAMKRYPKETSRFPTALFNLAECYFRLDRDADAKKTFAEFVGRFPLEQATWGARLRLAELEQLGLAAPASAQHQRVERLYEDVVNSRPYSPGAFLAQIRMAQCHRATQNDTKYDFFMNFFKARDLKKAESEILEPFEVEMAMDLAESRFFLQGERFEQAFKHVNAFREKYSKLPVAEPFKKVFARAAVGLVEELVREGKGAEALKVSSFYGDIVPKPEPFGYMLALAMAAFNEGNLEAVSARITVLKGLLANASAGEKDEFHLLNARFLRLTSGSAEAVIGELGLIRGDGPLSALKLDELAQATAAKNGKNGAKEDSNASVREAEAFDFQLIRGDLYKKLPLERQVAVHVRHIDSVSRLGRHSDVVKYADQALLKFGAYTQFAKELFRLRELRAQALYDSGEDKAAIEALAELIEADPANLRRSQFEFERGRSLVRIGKGSEALETFRKLSQSASDDVWRKSAKAELDQLQWEGKISNQTTDDRRSNQ
ncbi:MAG: tetratricopeptide repeat protein [Deltaproteobacteria bacterium]|nr:tetratricopeptide repeat protein [Deltaproteobacteria bacterium]